MVVATTKPILFSFFQQLLQQAIQTTPSIRPSQQQAQGGFFSGNILSSRRRNLSLSYYSIQQGLHSNHILIDVGGGITLSPIQDGSIAQNQLKSGTSTPLAPVSSGFHNNGFNIISSLAPTNSTVGSSPKIVPTIATTAFPTSSRPQQISLNSENSIITNASDNRNGLVNVQLQQGPILIPSSNANITSSLPIQSVVTAVPPVATAQENTACSVQTGPASVQGGLMQVMGSTPCLIPQPNGLPPLIVNVPTANYVQVPTQPPSGCNLPLVSSLLAANILANTNMLNGGVNNILNQPNNNAPRPTLVTSSDNALFIAPPTLPGLNSGSTNVSTANINLNSLVGCPQPRASVRPQIQVIHHTSSENKSNEAILASLDVPAGTAGIVLQKHSTDTTSNPSSLLASAVSPMEGDRKRLLLVKCQQPISRSGNVPSSVVDPLSAVSHELKDSIEDVESPSIPQGNGILRHISNIHSYSKENEYEVKKGARTDGMEILGSHKSPPPSSSSNYLQPHTQGFSDGLTNTTAWTDPQGGDSIESNTRQSKNSGKCSKNSMNKGKKLKKLSVNEPEALGKSGSAEKQPFIPEPEDSSDVGQDEVDTSRVTVDQTDSLNGSNTESMNVSSDPKCNEVTLKSKIEIQEDQIKMEGAQLNSLSTPSFSFTQYAADSPYPAASLNFSSVWNNLVPQGERKDSKLGPMSPSSSSRVHEKVHEINTTNIKKEVVGSDYIAPIDTINNMNSSMAPSLIKSEIVAEEDSLTNDSEDVSVPSFNNNHSQSRTSKDEGNR